MALREAGRFHDKLNDAELDEYLLSLAGPLEEADAMYHHFGYLLMHVRATIAYQVRPSHLQQAIQRAERFLKNYEASRTIEEAGTGDSK